MRAATVLVLAATLVAAAPPAGAEASGVSRPQAGAGDNVLAFDVYADGQTVHVLGLARRTTGGAVELAYGRSNDGGRSWQEPIRLPRQPGLEVHANGHGSYPPQIAAHGAQLVALWTRRGDGWGGAGPVIASRSEDGGRTWRHGPGPADVQHAAQAQGFQDVIAAAGGVFDAVWLDSRNGAQALYHARSADGGRTWSRDREIDPATCQCCRNTLAAAPDGALHVLYRDLDPRDMALAHSHDGGRHWRRLGTAGRFGWRFEGCPHTGGGLAVTAQRSYASVWTGAETHAGAWLLASEDGGRDWRRIARLGGAGARHTDVAVTAEGTVAVVWDASEAGQIGVYSAVIAPGRTDPGPAVLLHRSASVLGRPRIVATTGGLRAFWLETAPGGRSTWATVEIRESGDTYLNDLFDLPAKAGLAGHGGATACARRAGRGARWRPPARARAGRGRSAG